MKNGLAHGHAPPVAECEVDFQFAFGRGPLCLGRTVNVDRRLLQQFHRQLHHDLVIRIGLVELKHGELGVPAPAQAFIAKVAVDLIHAVKAAHR